CSTRGSASGREGTTPSKRDRIRSARMIATPARKASGRPRAKTAAIIGVAAPVLFLGGMAAFVGQPFVGARTPAPPMPPPDPASPERNVRVLTDTFAPRGHQRIRDLDRIAKYIGAKYPTTGNFIAIIGDLRGGSLVRVVKSAMIGATDLPVYSMNAPKAV